MTVPIDTCVRGRAKAAWACAVLWATLATGAAPGAAHAHLMVAQKGTLNFNGNGAYLLLSVPVSALKNTDDNGDGALSPAELQAHKADIEKQLLAGLRLHRNGQALPLEGLMLTLSPPDDAHQLPARQLVVMGKYTTTGAEAKKDNARYTFTLRLWGDTPAEAAHSLTVTRQAQKRVVTFTRGHFTQTLFAPR
jgi:hypothetical protein